MALRATNGDEIPARRDGVVWDRRFRSASACPFRKLAWGVACIRANPVASAKRLPSRITLLSAPT